MFLCSYNSKILTMRELSTSEQKAAQEVLKQKNGDIQHSLEKLPNGPEAAPSKSSESFKILLIIHFQAHRM